MTQLQPEPWLRGTLRDLSPGQRAVIHALQLAREDIDRWCGPLTSEELSAHPHDLAAVAFHMRHIAGSLDRLLTYAEGEVLSEEQQTSLAAEMEEQTSRDRLFEEFETALAAAEVRIRAIDPSHWPELRAVGRKQLPTTVAGLLIHCADHTQRHVGQAVTTAKVLLQLRQQSST